MVKIVADLFIAGPIDESDCSYICLKTPVCVTYALHELCNSIKAQASGP